MIKKERINIEQEKSNILLRKHISRYEFASRYVKNMIVLDIACGTGYGTALLANAGAKKVIGVDISKDAINFSKRTYQNSIIEFIVGDALNLRLSENVDIVVSFETIEHLEDPEKFLKNVINHLKQNGRFIVSTPIRKYGTISTKPKNPFHLREWNENEFISLLSKYFRFYEIYYQYDFSKLFFPFSRTIQRIIASIFFPMAVKEFTKYPVKNEFPIIPGVFINREYIIVVCSN